jgi:hypothetical protein
MNLNLVVVITDIRLLSNQDAMLQIPLLPEFAFSPTGDLVRLAQHSPQLDR